MTNTMKKLDGKVAIITGGASGIGEATAHAFANHGARAVVIADVQDEKGQRLVESIGAHRCSYIHCDVTDEEQVKGMVEWTVNAYGQLDIMFSNAGILPGSDQVIIRMGERKRETERVLCPLFLAVFSLVKLAKKK